MRHRLPALALVCALAVLAACGSDGSGDEVAADGPLATLTVIDQQVEAQAAAATEFSAATEGQELAAGDTVRTDTTGFADIGYFDGSLTRLTNDAEFTINELSDDEGERRVVTTLDAGRSWNRVRDLTGSDGTFQVDTPVASAVAQGTAFVVDCIAPGVCVFTVVEGTVEVILPDGTSIIVEEGESLVIEVDVVPGDPLASGVEALLTDPFIAQNVELDGDAGFDPVGQAAGPVGDAPLLGQQIATVGGDLTAASPRPPEVISGMLGTGRIVVDEEVLDGDNPTASVILLLDCTETACDITEVSSFFFPGHYAQERGPGELWHLIGLSFDAAGDEREAEITIDIPVPVEATRIGDVVTGYLGGTMQCAGTEVFLSFDFTYDLRGTTPASGTMAFGPELVLADTEACWLPMVSFGGPTEMVQIDPPTLTIPAGPSGP